MYQKKLMDHYKNPLYRGTIPSPDFASNLDNPSCGDAISFSGKIKDGKITAIKFEGTGCMLSQAAASILCGLALKQTIADLLNLKSEEIVKLMGIDVGPNRMQCIVLPLHALQKGLKE